MEYRIIGIKKTYKINGIDVNTSVNYNTAFFDFKKKLERNNHRFIPNESEPSVPFDSLLQEEIKKLKK